MPIILDKVYFAARFRGRWHIQSRETTPRIRFTISCLDGTHTAMLDHFELPFMASSGLGVQRTLRAISAIPGQSLVFSMTSVTFLRDLSFHSRLRIETAVSV